MNFRLPEKSGGGGEMVSGHWCHLTDPAEGQAPVDPVLGSVGQLNATGDESSFGGMKVW
jgi:hypothetical protein